MSNKNVLTRRLGLIIMSILIFCILIIFLSMYSANYKEITKAAGVELYGCANITTALIDPEDLARIKAGDTEAAKQVGESIDWTIQHKNIFEGQYIMDLEGTLLAVDENMLEQGFNSGDAFYISDEDLEQLQITKAPVYSEVYEFGGMKRLTGYAPIFEDHDPDKDIIAISAIDFESSILHSRTWDMIKGSFLTAIIPILLAGVATIFLIKKTTQPLHSIANFANRVAEGDLTVERLSIKNKDEIGQLSNDLNKMADNLKAILGDLSLSSTQVAATSEELSASAEEVSVTAEQNLHSIHHVRSGSEEQVGIVHNANQILTTIFNKTEGMNDKSKDLHIASENATEKAGYGEKMILESIKQMETINLRSVQMSDSMGKLSDKSDEISDIVSIITKISEQTNLLALNASIEAAHAGESGKGFAVVANEIRNLAEQSSEATLKISGLIHDIQTDTITAVEETSASIDSVKIGTDIIQDAGKAFQDIKTSINEVTTEINLMNNGISQITNDVEQIAELMKEIESISTETANNTSGVVSQSEEQVAAIEEVTLAMEQLSTMAEDLNKRTHQFKV